MSVIKQMSTSGSTRLCGVETDLKQVHCHIPLATIRDKFFRKIVHNAIIKRRIRSLDSQFKVIIGFVQLIPEEGVRLIPSYKSVPRTSLDEKKNTQVDSPAHL